MATVSTRIVTIPNLLSLFRLLLIPVFLVLLVNAQYPWVLLVLVASSLTDFVDGYLARRRDDITTFGKLMDPIADKLLIVAALVSLVSLNRVAAWVAMVIIAREFAVTAMRMAAQAEGITVSANMFGKVKTCLQIAMILTLIIVRDPSPWVDALIYVTVLATVASGVDYFFDIRRRMEAARERREAKKA